MQSDRLAKRVEILEKTVEGSGGLLERVDMLRADVDMLRADVRLLRSDVDTLRTEFLQFREETRGEFSSIRAEMRTGFAAVRLEMHEMRTDLIARIEAGEQETRSQMRLLHEEVITRIGVLAEGQSGRQKVSARAKKSRGRTH